VNGDRTDPVADARRKAERRLAVSDRKVALVKAEIERGLTTRALTAKPEVLEAILKAHVAQRDKTLEEIDALKTQPRWLLEKRLAPEK